MWFLGFLGVLAAVLASVGTVMGVRRRGAADFGDRLESRDQPGHANVDGQAAAGAAHHSRSSGAGTMGGF